MTKYAPESSRNGIFPAAITVTQCPPHTLTIVPILIRRQSRHRDAHSVPEDFFSTGIADSFDLKKLLDEAEYQTLLERARKHCSHLVPLIEKQKQVSGAR